jgi:hypothetical protein
MVSFGDVFAFVEWVDVVDMVDMGTIDDVLWYIWNARDRERGVISTIAVPRLLVARESCAAPGRRIVVVSPPRRPKL